MQKFYARFSTGEIMEWTTSLTRFSRTIKMALQYERPNCECAALYAGDLGHPESARLVKIYRNTSVLPANWHPEYPLNA